MPYVPPRYNEPVMMTLGQIGNSYSRSNMLHQLSLEREVSTVSQDEADNGAAQSDTVRFAKRQNSEETKSVPFSTYLQRVTQFSQTVKKDAGKKDKAEASSCPIEKARAESSVGANVPLNWLIADQMGGETTTPQAEDFMAPQPEPAFSEPSALFEATPVEVAPAGTLLDQEWLLTPCC